MQRACRFLAFALLGVVWLNNSTEGRKIRHRMDAVSESNGAVYRGD